MTSSTSNSTHFKLPIYDQESKEIELIKSKLILQDEVKILRTKIQEIQFNSTHQTQLYLNKWLNFEKRFSDRFHQLIQKDEINSNALAYIGISTLTGSILTRNRSIFLRFISPITFLTISFSNLMPKTYENLKTYSFDLQDQHFPNSALIRDDLILKSHQSLHQLNQLNHSFWNTFHQQFRNGKAQVFELLGLKVATTSSTTTTPTISSTTSQSK
ncbi:apolipo protein O-domain-containing protein [Melampsora americana]|nr:apolipo protein O-domain-containing protein [Melampsora americana]